jgi:transposase
VNFHPIERDAFLLPPDLREWLPKDHLAYFIADVAAALDLREFLSKYRADGMGATAYHPRILVGVILYAYCHGIRSSRQIERRCQEDIAFRIVAANQQPDHSTISRFVAEHTKAVGELFNQALKLCAQAGLVNVGIVSLDGTKLKANAALDSNRTRSKLQEEIDQMLALARTEDQREDALFGNERGDELPPELRDPQARRARLAACLKQVIEKEEKPCIEQAQKIAAWEQRQSGDDKRGGKPKPVDEVVVKEAKANVTDPESRIMQTRSGYVQGYNAQLAVTKEQIILAADVTQEATDRLQLQPMVTQIGENAAAVLTPVVALGTLLTDAGYYRDADVEWSTTENIDWLCATRKEWKHERELKEQRPPGAVPECLTVKDRMERRLIERYAQYKLRSQTVEPVIGQLKEVNNGRRCSRRGLTAVRSEWRLTCAAHNLLKLYRSRKAEQN